MPKLPKRPREHVLESESGQFAVRILPSEWILRPVYPDYGVDLLVEVVEKELVTGASFFIQLKSEDEVKLNKTKQFISHSCQVSTLNYFLELPLPVIYLVFDATKSVGYWVWIKDYLQNWTKPGWQAQKSLTIRIPVKSRFDKHAISDIRKRVLNFQKKAKWQTAVDAVDNEHYSYALTTDSEEGVQVKIRPRSGTSPEAQIRWGLQLQWDLNDPEGQSAYNEYQQYLKTGSPVSIDEQFVSHIDLPEALNPLRLLLGNFSKGSFFLGASRSDEIVPVRLEVYDENDILSYELRYLELKATQVGSEEITFTNEDQLYPLKMSLRLNTEENLLNMQITLVATGSSIHQISEAIDSVDALKPGKKCRIIDLNTGTAFLEGAISNNHGLEVDQEFRELIDKLIFILEKLKLGVIAFPDEITEEQFRDILTTVEVLKNGWCQTGPLDLSWGMNKADGLAIARMLVEGDRSKIKWHPINYQVDVLGENVSLGPATLVVTDYEPSKRTLQLPEHEDLFDEETTVTIEIKVNESGCYVFCHDWIQDEDLIRMQNSDWEPETFLRKPTAKQHIQ